MEYYSSLDASQLDAETPTLFELISANQLESLLSPSLRYILVHYASRYPYYLLKVVNKFDELNLLLRSFIEWYFMKYWQGSFTENFYGLKRVSQTPLSTSKYNSGKLTQLVPSMIEERRELNNLQKLVSIFEITGVAYISEKFNYWYEIWYPKLITNQLEPENPDSSVDVYKTLLKKWFVQCYPYIRSVLKAGNFITVLLYLSGRSKSPSLLTYLFKMNYARLNQYDYSKNEPAPPRLPKDSHKHNRVTPPTTTEYLLRFLTRYFTKPSWRVIRFILGTFFPVAIFSLKFLEWWNNSNFSQRLKRNQGEDLDTVLPSPSILSALKKPTAKAKFAEEKLKPKMVYKSGKNCPLCHEPITNPAVIETGYVFCYSCIYNYLANSHKLVAAKAKVRQDEEESESESTSDEDSDEDLDTDANGEKGHKKESKKKHKRNQDQSDTVNLNKGGRCPITGKKLLGCKWNALKEEWDVEGLRRLIF